MNPNQAIIDRIMDTSTEELIELLGIDIHSLIQDHAQKILEAKTQEELLEYI